MFTNLFILLLNVIVVLPTLLVVVSGQRLLARFPLPESSLVKFGMVAALLMALPYAVLSNTLSPGNLGLYHLLVLPALDGLLALLVINWRLVYEFWQRETKSAGLMSLLLLAALLLTAISHPWLALLLAAPPLLAALIWMVGIRVRVGWLAFLAAILTVILALDALGIAGSHFVFSLDWLRTVYKLTSGAAALLALVLSAVLVDRAIPARDRANHEETPGSASRSPLLQYSRSSHYLFMAGLLLLGAAAVTLRHGVLTNATGRAYEDHLPFGTLAAALVSGLVLAFARSQRKRRAGLWYLLLVTAVIATAYSLGWQVDFEAITTARAARLSQSISQFRQDRGNFPAHLDELSPAYQPVIFGPLTGRGQVWCYQSGTGYYRLGYVYFQRYYEYPDDTPFWEPYYEIKVPYNSGEPPAGQWICDQELQLYKDHGGL